MSDTVPLRDQFIQKFGVAPRLFRAPGRVNLIGEHTDYNDGFVMPAALEFEAEAAATRRDDRIIRIHSLNNGETAEFDLDAADNEPRRNWTDYAFGVAVMLEGAGKKLPGAEIMISSSVPVGSGLSSSAALEVVVGYTLLSLAGETEIDTVELAKLCQKAENEYVGMRCGIMDQFISCNGVHDHALMIDCRSLEKRPVPIDPKARIVVANSMVHHALADGEYNKRRDSCEEGVRLLKPALGEIAALRDVSFEELEENRDFLSDVTYRRCRHIVTENERVEQAADALDRGDLETFGLLMNASHASMRDDYEISCEEVDILVDIAQGQKGVFGARMTGGGFGGCIVALVAVDDVDAFIENVRAAYKEATGFTSDIFACAPQAGVGPLA
ncbi:galactokinase [Martelella endophytica]|uniref:Galactokinase n=1 Tax=Martelella endophytica TaxID=1486262 RepID=A0A0D5LQ83_MAREN|nr:galactokinase [Martelella endophytica]AJY45493.1 galactokinase [Martelella endophytica]